MESTPGSPDGRAQAAVPLGGPVSEVLSLSAVLLISTASAPGTAPRPACVGHPTSTQDRRIYSERTSSEFSGVSLEKGRKEGFNVQR